jgi:cytochrome P450
VEKLVYTRQIFAESMRLYPPAWIMSRRNNDADVSISHDGAKYTIPRGTNVAASPYIIHRDPRFWDEPERFNPDRFASEVESSRPKLAYFPFGAGTRQCIGEHFAWMEAVLVLATIGQKWRLQLPPRTHVKTLPRITLRPRGAMRMRLQAKP